MDSQFVKNGETGSIEYKPNLPLSDVAPELYGHRATDEMLENWGNIDPGLPPPPDGPDRRGGGNKLR